MWEVHLENLGCVSKNRGFSPQIIHKKIGVFQYIQRYHPFCGTLIFGNTHVVQPEIAWLLKTYLVPVYGICWLSYLFFTAKISMQRQLFIWVLPCCHPLHTSWSSFGLIKFQLTMIIWIDTMSEDTPLKTNGWNLKIIPVERKMHLPNLQFHVPY